MGVQFYIRGSGPCFDEEGNETGVPYVDFHSAGARRVVLQLGLPGGDESQVCGEVRGKELREACELYLKNVVPELEAEVPWSEDGRFIDCGQREGRFTERVKELLELAKRAGDLGVITYG